MKEQIGLRYYGLITKIQTPAIVEKFFRRYAIATMCCIMCLCFASFAFATTGGNLSASGGVFDAASKMFLDLYLAIAGISTAAAVVAEAVAATLYFFSSNGKTVEQAQDWMKRIAIGWLIINGMGAIVATAKALTSGYKLTSF